VSRIEEDVVSGSRACLSFAELADYWAADDEVDLAAIEAHVFECAACARLLSDAEELRHAIRMATAGGHVQMFVTDGVLNRLARDGVRMRSYTLEPGEAIHCAAWADDEVMVTRLRGDFRGVTAVDAEMHLEGGEQVGQALDVPIRPGASELIMALPAPFVRDAPQGPMKLTLRRSSDREGVLGEYIFDHEGSFDRGSE
jgi:hypothetical protein